MLDRLIAGAAAGAVGTAALNLTTYLDILVRGRPPSSVPKQTARRLTEMAGVETGQQQERAEHRLTGIGALLGYATGIGIGAAWGLASPLLGRPSPPTAGLVLGAAAMAASDLPATAVGASDPRGWGLRGWLADLVPHAAYGLCTALAFSALAPRRRWPFG